MSPVDGVQEPPSLVYREKTHLVSTASPAPSVASTSPRVSAEPSTYGRSQGRSPTCAASVAMASASTPGSWSTSGSTAWFLCYPCRSTPARCALPSGAGSSLLPHSAAHEKPFFCPQYPEGSGYSNLQHHQQDHGGSGPTTVTSAARASDRAQGCVAPGSPQGQDCECSFRSSSGLAQHLQGRSGERPFCSGGCGFTQSPHRP